MIARMRPTWQPSSTTHRVILYKRFFMISSRYCAPTTTAQLSCHVKHPGSTQLNTKLQGSSYSRKWHTTHKIHWNTSSQNQLTLDMHSFPALILSHKKDRCYVYGNISTEYSVYKTYFRQWMAREKEQWKSWSVWHRKREMVIRVFDVDD